MPCLSDDAVMAFAEGRLPDGERPAVERHLDGCEGCRLLVAEMARLVRPASPPEAGAAEATASMLAPGTKVSRYLAGRLLGAGSGGVVYEAYDPELKRKVGLKLLRDERLRDEAQTMARLSHPNVVSVYDVGTFEGGLFIVMEYVEGATLTDWLREKPRSWRDVLAVFLAAGRGLAAAHAAKLVHHDFKPDNVLVGADGVARVTDFGLARPVDAPARRPAGTPAFMAPEQARARAPDARTDQFSFCVALHWALHGRHPFNRRPLPGAAETAVAREVPDWLDAVIQRGLRLDPEQRYPSMDELLGVLAGPARGAAERRRWLPLAVAPLAVAAVWLLARDRPPAPPAASGPPPPRLAVVPTCDDPASDRPRRVPSQHCFAFDEGPRDWEAAEKACEASGGALATCISRNECTQLGTAVPADRPSWIGLHDRRIEGTFEWITDEGFEPYLAAERWAGGPGNAEGRDCVALAPSVADGGSVRAWTVSECGRGLGFLCESAPWLIAGPIRRAYRALRQPLTWAEARAACERLGAHLITIGDAGEQALVELRYFSRGNQLASTVWLGATDGAEEGRFRWVTGEPFAYHHFHPIEPDNRDGQQNCVALAAGDRLYWHDRNCEVRYPALCEKELP